MVRKGKLVKFKNRNSYTPVKFSKNVQYTVTKHIIIHVFKVTITYTIITCNTSHNILHYTQQVETCKASCLVEMLLCLL